MNGAPSCHRQLVAALVVLVTPFVYGVAASPTGTRGARYLALHVALSALMFAAWWLAHRTDRTPAAAGDDRHWAVVAGLTALAALVAVPAFTTHDVTRYLWDGHAALAGFDPYRLTPDSTPASLTQGWLPPTDNKNFPTIYPPGAIAVFALCAGLGADLAPHAWKLLVTAAAAGTILVIARLLREIGRARDIPLIALSPILILEAGVGAHLDVLCGFSIALALLAFARERPALAGTALGIGALIKLAPILLVLPMALGGTRGSAFRLVIAAAATIATGYLGAGALGWEPIGSLFVFFQKWEFGSPLFSALAAMSNDQVAGTVLVACGGFAYCLALADAPRHPHRAFVVALAIPLVVSPVAFPWYLALLVPVVALWPSRTALLWMMTLPLSYEVLDTFEVAGAWNPAVWPLIAVGLGWVVGLTFDLFCEQSARKPVA